jgi:hypothetical protein
VPRAVRLVLAVALVALVAPAAASAATVLYVGDSLGVGTVPRLRGLLPGTTIRADNRVGRPSPETLRVLSARLRGSDDVVVFDSGTNDNPRATGTYARVLATARRIAGARCLVIATISRPTSIGAPPTRMNRVVSSFAASDPAVQVADWRGVVGQRGVLGPDRVHGTGRGYALRAQLMAQAIQGCLTVGSAGDESGTYTPSTDPETVAPSAPGPKKPHRRKKPKPKPVRLGPMFRPYWAPTVKYLRITARVALRETRSLASIELP